MRQRAARPVGRRSPIRRSTHQPSCVPHAGLAVCGPAPGSPHRTLAEPTAQMARLPASVPASPTARLPRSMAFGVLTPACWPHRPRRGHKSGAPSRSPSGRLVAASLWRLRAFDSAPLAACVSTCGEWVCPRFGKRVPAVRRRIRAPGPFGQGWRPSTGGRSPSTPGGGRKPSRRSLAVRPRNVPVPRCVRETCLSMLSCLSPVHVPRPCLGAGGGPSAGAPRCVRETCLSMLSAGHALRAGDPPSARLSAVLGPARPRGPGGRIGFQRKIPHRP
jgi:hypothetical protein